MRVSVLAIALVVVLPQPLAPWRAVAAGLEPGRAQQKTT